MSESVTQIDARRLLCPLPVIRLQDAARDRKPGSVLELVATDPGTREDIPAWCRVHGHDLTELTEANGELTFRVRLCSD